MLNIKDIEKFYPENEKVFKRNLLREYLQYKILQIIYNSNYAGKLNFMGGTCLRVVYGTQRFSEDLDFDNINLSENELEIISSLVKKTLELEGYLVEIRNVFKGAFRCYLRLPGLLFSNKLSGYHDEKILIQLDTESQGFIYKKETFLLNKFDIFSQIFITPKDILLSQKLWAILNRKVLKGRDFYDAVYLFALTKPNYDYLTVKANIRNIGELKDNLFEILDKVKMESLAKDVEPFLINKNEIARITKFKEYLLGLK
ncbi:MAG: nucleotidyl transferase AbiEii/AbiGii toxin family protein [bacterium]